MVILRPKVRMRIYHSDGRKRYGINDSSCIPCDIYNLATYDAKIYPDIQELYSIIDGNVGETLFILDKR